MSSGTSSPSLEDRGGLSPPPHRSPVSSETRAFGGTSLRRSSDGKSVHAALETVSRCSVGCLKNVIVAFMTNRIGRDKMLLAIATILQFSPEELRTVQSQTKTSSGGRSWFLGGGGS
eukprot:m.1057625 g.1057625  ORF g.1057625 m.1057625 type:complete len:117 (+) comp24205_c0_seq34:3542-3892(+)